MPKYDKGCYQQSSSPRNFDGQVSVQKTVHWRRYLRWLWAPLAFIVAAGCLFAYALSIQRTAQSILNDVVDLKVGRSSLEDVKAMAARHRPSISKYDCNADKCIVAFEVDNTWLRRLKLEPHARFQSFIECKGGIVVYIMVVLERDTRAFPTSPSAGITEEYLTPPSYYAQRAPYWFPTPVGKPYLRVGLTPEASPLQREHAYYYSFRCLTKVGRGCDLPCDYLPIAWHDWEARLQQEGWGFGSAYTDRKRCE